MEDADDIIRSRVVGARLVTVVEPVQLRDDEPERNAREEHEVLGAHPKPVDLALGRRIDDLAERKRERQTEQIRVHECASHQPAAALEPRALAVREDVERPLVERRRQAPQPPVLGPTASGLAEALAESAGLARLGRARQDAHVTRSGADLPRPRRSDE